jgi:Ni,Fe-hydrogenase III small subunit
VVAITRVRRQVRFHDETTAGDPIDAMVMFTASFGEVLRDSRRPAVASSHGLDIVCPVHAAPVGCPPSPGHLASSVAAAADKDVGRTLRVQVGWFVHPAITDW